MTEVDKINAICKCQSIGCIAARVGWELQRLRVLSPDKQIILYLWYKHFMNPNKHIYKQAVNNERMVRTYLES